MSGTSAYCLIEGDGKTFTILKSYKEPKHKEPKACKKYLLEQINNAQAKCIGIDAPLSIPKPLYDQSFTTSPREGNGEITNPYLYRYTDYWLFNEFGLRPMPPAGDRIGRLTARAIELLHTLDLPIINEKIIEIYPKQIAYALGLPEYKNNYLKLLKRLGQSDYIGDEHQMDALLAAYATMRIDHGETVLPPKGENEGWCYILKI